MTSFAHLRTGRGNILAAGPTQADMADVGAPHALVAFIPDTNRQLVFLLAPDLRQMEIRGDGLRSAAISAFRLQTADPGIVRLRHPLVPLRFLGVTPPGAGAANGCVIFDSLGSGGLDLFEILPVDGAAVSWHVARAAAEMEAACARPFRADSLLERLHARQLRPDLAEAMIRVLPGDELQELARLLMHAPRDLELLRHCVDGNPWFSRVLPELAAWRARRGAVPGGILHSPPADEFAGDPMEGHGQPQAGQALAALARARIRPRRGACLLAAARNEGPYVLEWLAYHFSIGFEHAFIYSNDNFDRSDRLLETLAEHGAITLVQNPAGAHCGPQYKMHAHALSLLPQILDYRWAALIDLDEFIGFDARRFRGIDDFLAWHETQPVDAIALCWQIFAARAEEAWRDEFTPLRFTRREAEPNRHVKTIFRPAKFWHSHVHYPHASLGQPFVFRGENGAVHHQPGPPDRNPAFAPLPGTDLAWVNHYWLRTAAETVWKLARGHGDWKGDAAVRHLEMAQMLCRNFTALAARTDLVEDRRILACTAGLASELARLRGLRGVAAAEAHTKAEFRRRMPSMVQAFIASAPAGGDEPGEFPPFRAALRSSGHGGIDLTNSKAEEVLF